MTAKVNNCCPVCGSRARLRVQTQDFNRQTSDQTFVYYYCPKCKLVFIESVPPDLDLYYSSEYYSVPTSLPELAQMAGSEQYKLDLVRRFVTDGHLVDVGAGNGKFAYLAKQAGFYVETIERDRSCSQFHTNVLGVGSMCTGAENSLYQLEACDGFCSSFQNDWLISSIRSNIPERYETSREFLVGGTLGAVPYYGNGAPTQRVPIARFSVSGQKAGNSRFCRSLTTYGTEPSFLPCFYPVDGTNRLN